MKSIAEIKAANKRYNLAVIMECKALRALEVAEVALRVSPSPLMKQAVVEAKRKAKQASALVEKLSLEVVG